MVKRMRLWVVGAFLLAIGGTVVASNMGFKFVPNFNAGGSTIVHTIGFPLNNNYVNAKDVRDDITASGCTAGTVQRRNTNQTIQSYAGIGTPFLLNKQEGLRTTVGGAGCTSWVVVGSWDPAYVYQFPTASPSQYLVTMPYHTTAINARDVFLSGPFSGVRRINRNQTIQAYAGIGTPFPITIGEPLIVLVTAASSTWVPPHY